MTPQTNGSNGNDLQPGILVDSQIQEALDEHWLGIDPFDQDLLEPATYDLTIGSRCILTSETEVINLAERRTVIIQPFSLAFLESDEVLRLHPKLTGRIGLKRSLLSQGIVASTGPQLDPGFRGRLFVTLINFMDRPFFIEYKQPFISVEFHALSRAPTKSYEGKNQGKTELLPSEINTILGRGGPGFKEIHRDLLELTHLVKNIDVWGRDLPTTLQRVEEWRDRAAAPLRVPITTLAPEPYRLRQEIVAVVEQVEDSFVATHFDANLSASGDTREEAIQNLKTLLVEIFEDLSSEEPERLGKEPSRQLAVLRELLSEVK